MRTDIFTKVADRRNQVVWLSLAFQGGFMNAGGFLACHRSVFHMTGYSTHVGVALGRGPVFLSTLEMALAPLFFSRGRGLFRLAD